MSLEDFLKRAVELCVDGVSIESCFLPRTERSYLKEVGAFLDQYGLERVYAWGHPLGLEGGRSDAAYEEMLRHFPLAEAMGARIMRVVGSNRRLMDTPRQEQLGRLIPRFREATKRAEDCGLRLAIENHIDFTADDLLQLIGEVDSPHLGVNFDTGNAVRLLEDPLKAVEKLAHHVYATHIKDVRPQKGLPADSWCFFACVPVGEGLVDTRQVAQILKQSDYKGFLAVEIDYLHADYADEDAAVARSVEVLREIASSL